MSNKLSPARPARSLLLAFSLGVLAGALIVSTPALRRADAAPGLANPADDRNRMIAELQRLNATADAIRDAIASGKLKVQVVQGAPAAN